MFSSFKAPPKQVKPPACKSFHTKSSELIGCGYSQRTIVLNWRAAIFMAASGLSDERSFRSGTVSRMASFNEPILSPSMLPEVSTKKNKTIVLRAILTLSVFMVFLFFEVYKMVALLPFPKAISLPIKRGTVSPVLDCASRISPMFFCFPR